MSLIDHILPRFERLLPHRPTASDIKVLTDEVDQNNQLFRAILEQVMPGMSLHKDYKMKDYIADGYEKNADVFAIIDRLSTMFSQLVINVMQNDEVVENELSRRLDQPNVYQVWNEWAKLWYTFYLVTGNGIIYAPRLTGGNNTGRLMPNGMFCVPTQNVEIKTGGWRDPIQKYIIDLNLKEEIPAEDIIHIRMPNLQYAEGANYMGMSPLKVAAMIIEAENQGYQTIADTLARGIPPGILTRVDADSNSMEQQAALERTYVEKYGSQKLNRTGGRPVLGSGDLRWIQMGFSNFRDLQIIELSQHGLRVLCNVLGVPAVAFNDVSGAQHWNMKESRKMVYTNRLIPDMALLLKYLNVQIAPAYGNVTIKADYSNIPELQDDKKELASWIETAVRWGYPPEKMFEMLGLEATGNPALSESYLPFNVLPAGQETITETEALKLLKEKGIDDYKNLKVV